MARFTSGALGRFKGKVDTIVGARWRGIDYIRHKGEKRTKPGTQAQLEQQAKFSIVGKFVKKLSKVLTVCYTGTPDRSPVNIAFTEVYQKALTGSYPNFNLDYRKIAISKGDLLNAALPKVIAAGGGNIRFDWEDNSDGNLAMSTDKAILVAYCPELQLAIHTLQGAERSVTTETLAVKNFTGMAVETWIAFMSANGKAVSSSNYTGEIIVT